MMQDNEVFDLCIIGAGMIGSSAAAYASRKLKSRVILIGPSENTVFEAKNDVYGAHYDNGRLTNTGQRDLAWAYLAASSINKYREIEAESGIKFFDNVGLLFVGDINGDYLKGISTLMKLFKCGRFLTRNELSERFPDINIHSHMTAIFDESGGIINPRKLIQAQFTIAKSNGCHILDDVVHHVCKKTVDNSLYEIVTDNGHVIYSKKILLAAGCYSNNRNLIPDVKNLPFVPITQTVALFEVSEKDRERFRHMPPAISSAAGNGSIGHYFLPPIQYPNGKYYIKIGHWSDFEEPRITSDEIKNWWKTYGFSDGVEVLKNTCLDFVKDFKPVSITSDRCLTTVTNDRSLIIDHVGPGYVVAIGGNGKGAKSSVEIGQIAADLVIQDEWNCIIPHSVFKLDRSSLRSKAKL